jgi:proteasome regulatory subunit
MLDPALLRPGRFDRLIKIPLPDLIARQEILKIHTRAMHLENVSIESIAAMTENTTGAELQAVCREAGMMAVRRDGIAIEMPDFILAVRKVKADTITDSRMYT